MQFYLCFKHLKKSLKKTVSAQGGQDCRSLGQTAHIVSYVASGTQSGVQCPRKKNHFKEANQMLPAKLLRPCCVSHIWGMA